MGEPGSCAVPSRDAGSDKRRAGTANYRKIEYWFNEYCFCTPYTIHRTQSKIALSARAFCWFQCCPRPSALSIAPSSRTHTLSRRATPCQQHQHQQNLESLLYVSSHVGDGLGKSCGLLCDLASNLSSFSVSLSLSRDILSSSVRSFTCTWVRP